MTHLVVCSDVGARVERARTTWNNHPAWCVPDRCSASRTGGGDHESETIRVDPAHPAEPCAVAVFLASSPLADAPLVYIETYHDPAVNEALDMDDEPNVTILSPTQAARLHTALGQTLARLDG